MSLHPHANQLTLTGSISSPVHPPTPLRRPLHRCHLHVSIALTPAMRRQHRLDPHQIKLDMRPPLEMLQVELQQCRDVHHRHLACRHPHIAPRHTLIHALHDRLLIQSKREHLEDALWRQIDREIKRVERNALVQRADEQPFCARPRLRPSCRREPDALCPRLLSVLAH